MANVFALLWLDFLFFFFFLYNDIFRISYGHIIRSIMSSLVIVIPRIKAKNKFSHFHWSSVWNKFFFSSMIKCPFNALTFFLFLFILFRKSRTQTQCHRLTLIKTHVISMSNMIFSIKSIFYSSDKILFQLYVVLFWVTQILATKIVR